jgi:hypothetical protein
LIKKLKNLRCPLRQKRGGKCAIWGLILPHFGSPKLPVLDDFLDVLDVLDIFKNALLDLWNGVFDLSHLRLGRLGDLFGTAWRPVLLVFLA